MQLSFFCRLVLSVLLFCSTRYHTRAQLKVGENPQTISNSAVLEVESSSKGFLPPRMTTAQRNAIVNPPMGLIVYNTSLVMFTDQYRVACQS